MRTYYTSKVTASYWRYNYPWVTLIFGSTNSLKSRCFGVTSIRSYYRMSLRETSCERDGVYMSVPVSSCSGEHLSGERLLPDELPGLCQLPSEGLCADQQQNHRGWGWRGDRHIWPSVSLLPLPVVFRYQWTDMFFTNQFDKSSSLCQGLADMTFLGPIQIIRNQGDW